MRFVFDFGTEPTVWQNLLNSLPTIATTTILSGTVSYLVLKATLKFNRNAESERQRFARSERHLNYQNQALGEVLGNILLGQSLIEEHRSVMNVYRILDGYEDELRFEPSVVRKRDEQFDKASKIRTEASRYLVNAQAAAYRASQFSVRDKKLRNLVAQWFNFASDSFASPEQTIEAKKLQVEITQGILSYLDGLLPVE